MPAGSPEAWIPPETIDEYRLVRPLGQGAMGQVYLAHDTLLERAVAIKFISNSAPDVHARDRFIVEARAIARLHHPNVVAVYRIGTVRGRPYLVSEFVRGKPLDALKRPLAPSLALKIAVGLSRGLAAAHRHGVIHRDIKPANTILADGDEPKLLDFGLARLSDNLARGAAPSTQEVQIAGPTPAAVLAVPQVPPEVATLRTVAAEPTPTTLPQRKLDAAEITIKPDATAPDPLGDLLGDEEISVTDATLDGRFQTHRSSPTVQHPPLSAEARATRDRLGAAAALARDSVNATDATADSGAVTKPRAYLRPFASDEVARIEITADMPLDEPLRPSTQPEPTVASGSTPHTITQEGALVGTPLYMAPEAWCGQVATPRSDVYSLGAMVYELCAGFAPHFALDVESLGKLVTERDARPLRDVAPTVDEGFAQVVDRCLRRDPSLRFADGEALREALERLTPEGRAQVVPEGNPYRGLQSFDARHRALFFGRDAEVSALVDRLRTESFVLVAGDSGVGKSSLCRAGVLPRIGDGAWGDGRSWLTVEMVPGRRPLGALASLLAPLVQASEDLIAHRLRDDPEELGRTLRRREGRGLAIFVDQLEELVTLSEPAEAHAFAEAFVGLLGQGPTLRLLATVRADFLARVATLPALGDECARSLYLCKAMSTERVRDAIVGPARTKGVTFESDALVGELAQSITAEGSLPLLQFALAELWEARDTRRQTIPRAALDGIGGVSGALARHGDNVLARMLPAERAAARRCLTLLVTAQGSRARRSEAELTVGDAGKPDRAARGALEALVRGRLLVAREADDGTAYEVAHEALITGWTTLRGWLADDADERAVRERLESAAAEWQRLGRPADVLWSDRQLREAEILDGARLGTAQQGFLDASRSALRQQRLRRRFAVASVAVLALLVYGGVRWKLHHDLDRAITSQLDVAHAALTEARRLDDDTARLRAQAFARFDARDKAAAETTWSQALERGAAADRAYGRALQAAESALGRDASRRDVRDLIGDLLYQRALGAERDEHRSERDELVERLALYDADGSRARRWNAPAHLSIASATPAAALSLARYNAAVNGKRVLGSERLLGAPPVENLELDPGSYLLTLRAPGHDPVLYPIVVVRDEARRITLDAPSAPPPRGFVYIPPGRFEFGSSQDESLRREFLTSTPRHTVETGAYMIAQSETTFAEWIAFLEAQPAEARERHTPHVANIGGSFGLQPTSDGRWHVNYTPRAREYSARSGEKIHYGKRDRRVEQDWLRMPVFGINADDAEAYVAWLRSTGRVPGARLCDEREWERAARGADDRELPTGDHLDPDDADFDETYGREPLGYGPDEVGAHPASRSPFGVDDMAGNLYEWTTSAVADRETVLRGGAFLYGELTCRSTNRSVTDRAVRDLAVGMRVCADAR